MGLMGPGLFPEPDRAHFEQPRSEFTGGFGMCLRAPQNDDPVSFGGEAVQVSDCAVFGLAERERFHRGTDRNSSGLLGYSEPAQDFHLPFRSRAAVTPHGGKEEGL